MSKVHKKVYPNGVSHPAVFSDALIPVFAEHIKLFEVLMGFNPVRILDPFAGVGRIHELRKYSTTWETLGVEIEQEWAELSEHTLCANALDLPFGDDEFDVICTSPTYGNRMADHHNAQDGSLRRSYTHDLGHTLHWENSGQMQWGREYREFHENAWSEAVRVLRHNGLFLLNCKDHIRGGKRMYVCNFHLLTLRKLGVQRLRSIKVGTPHMRAGVNSDLRLSEMIYVCQNKKARTA
jgi:SAM-dependent methyltransferase